MNRFIVRASQLGLFAVAAATWFGASCQKAQGGGELPDHVEVDEKGGARPKGVYKVVDADPSTKKSSAEEGMTSDAPPHRHRPASCPAIPSRRAPSPSAGSRV